MVNIFVPISVDTARTPKEFRTLVRQIIQVGTFRSAMFKYFSLGNGTAIFNSFASSPCSSVSGRQSFVKNFNRYRQLV